MMLCRICWQEDIGMNARSIQASLAELTNFAGGFRSSFQPSGLTVS